MKTALQTKLLPLIACLALGFSAGAANATTKYAGSLPEDSSTFTLFTHVNTHVGGTSFSDVLNFDVSQLSTLSASVFSVRIPLITGIVGLTGTLFNSSNANLGSFVLGSGVGPISFNSQSFSPSSPLDTGSYHFSFTGKATGFLGGGYLVALSATPVPEAETSAMFLAGLGVIGAIASRRRKSV